MSLPCDPERYRPLLRLQARQFRLHPVLRRRLDDSDLVQVTLIRAHERQDQFCGTTEPELIRWLSEILANVTVDAIRHEEAQMRDPRREIHLEEAVNQSSAQWIAILPDADDTPAHAAQKREQLDALTVALDQLPEDQRDAIVAKDLLGLSVQAVAERMDKTDQAIAGLLRRGRRRLKELMQMHNEVHSDA